MVKKSLSILLIFTLIMSMFVISVSAAASTIVINSPTYNAGEGTLTVSGTVANGDVAIKDVAIQIWKPTGTLLTFVTATVNGQNSYSEEIQVGTLASGTYTVKAADYKGGQYFTTTFTVEATNPPTPTTYTVTFAPKNAQGTSITGAVVTFNGVTNAAGSYAFSNVAAGTYSYTVTKSGYNTATGFYTVSGNATVDVTLTAVVITPPPSGNGGSTTTPPPTTTTPEPVVTTTTPNTATVEVKPVVDTKTGAATTTVTQAQIDKIVAAVSKNGTAEVKLELKVEAAANATSYKQEIPASVMTSDSKINKIAIETPVAKVEINPNMLNNISTSKTDVVGISMETVKPADIPQELAATIGTRPVLDLNISVNGENVKWSNAAVPVTVTVPYVPTAAELAKPNSIVVWYINDAGKIEPVTNAKFDPKTNTITFKTTHFSKYAVAFVEKSFKDLADVAWAKASIEALASKGVINGVSADKFNPNADITRADFLKMMISALGLSAEVKGSFSDVDKNAYYADTVGIGKALGIVVGENGKFRPTDKITRQELMTIAYRAIKASDVKLAGGTTADIEAFKDKAKISNYALESIQSLVKDGIVNGSNGNINPTANTTRAEAAAIIYRVLNK